jgi:glycosyltransferase involved in cell wall biosynthesis
MKTKVMKMMLPVAMCMALVVGVQAKSLAGAKCLVVPSLVSETSSLVAMESLACGTPVVAFRKGALTDIVEDGKTGFLVSEVDEMAEAIRNVTRLDRKVCRDAAVRRFSADRMAEQYIRTYRQILKRSVSGWESRD